ncbi:hypothetical protein SUGI_0439450 [Cryptomeria japonica]|nr:hypothetical protein SUGI_0439450 [Cryptomeria japonica]
MPLKQSSVDNSTQCFLDQSAKFLPLRLMEGGRKFLSTLLAVLDQGEIEKDFRFTDSRGAAETEWGCSIVRQRRYDEGASMDLIRSEKWIAGLSPERKKMSKMLARCLLHSRIVVFVDNLDRCQENVILQILSGVNLVLAVCKINNLELNKKEPSISAKISGIKETKIQIADPN